MNTPDQTVYFGFRPVGENVFVALERAEDTSKGGIFIPDKAREEPVKGRLLSLGEKAREMEPDLIPGHVVWVPRQSGTEFTQEGVNLVVVNVKRLLGYALPEEIAQCADENA